MAKNFTPFQYCVNEVKKFNYEHYVIGLLIPSLPARKTFFALRSLNIELASIIDSSSTKNSQTSYARLVWWKSALDSLFEKKPPLGHPVLQSLKESVDQGDVSRYLSRDCCSFVEIILFFADHSF